MTNKNYETISTTVSIHPLLRLLSNSSSLFLNEVKYEEISPIRHTPSTTNIDLSQPTGASFSQHVRHVLEVEKNAIELLAKQTQAQKASYQERITKELLSVLSFFSYDDESIEPVWYLCERILNESTLSTLGTVLQDIYLSHNDDPNILCGICKYLTTFDLDEVSPWGPLILIGMLNHKDETVKEYAVMLLDNWKDETLIPVLRNLDCKSSWLRAYIQDVLSSLGG